MSEVRVLGEYRQQTRYVGPILRGLGSEVPAPGQGVVFAEFDDAGQVRAFQVVQDVVMVEGLYARDGNAQLRRVWRAAIHWLQQRFAGTGRWVLVICTSEKMARCAERMGCERMPQDWILMRRKF